MRLVPKLAALVVAAGSVLPAQAAIVTQWDATLTSLWTAFAPAAVISDMGGLRLRWGTDIGNGQSSLVITNPGANQVIDTFIGGGMPPQVAPFLGSGGALTHNNNAIQAPSLDSATLTATLNLSALAPPNPGQPGNLPPLNFNIAFEETPNQTPCAATSPPGNPCNDIFVLTGGLLNQSFFYDSDAGGPDPTQQYFVNIFPVAGGVLNVLSNAECVAAGQGPGCIGFTTIEGQSNRLAFGFTISTQRLTVVPEPGSLALLGLGLAGLGALRRRRG